MNEQDNFRLHLVHTLARQMIFRIPYLKGNNGTIIYSITQLSVSLSQPLNSSNSRVFKFPRETYVTRGLVHS